MLVLKYYQLMISFLEENAALIVILVSVVEPLKQFIKGLSFYKPWMTYAIAGVVSLIMAIPEAGFTGVEYIPLYLTHSVGLFLTATGLYKVLFDRSTADEEAKQAETRFKFG